MEQNLQIKLSGSKVNGAVCFSLLEDYNNLLLQVDVKDKLVFSSYIVITDSNNIIRLQRLLSHGDHKYMLSDSSNTTSLGGYPGPIGKGSWQIKLFGGDLDGLSEEEKTVYFHINSNVPDMIIDNIGTQNWMNYNLEKQRLTLNNYDDTNVISKEKKWYAGDFHTHTRLSDGKEYLANAIKNAKNMNLQFYVTTEHNVIHTGFVDTDLLGIPGIEITTMLGHFNIFGLKELPVDYEDFLCNLDDNVKTEVSVLTFLKNNRKKGYLNSMNHPFLHVWKWEYGNIPLDLFDTIEIVNDPTYNYAKEANNKAINLVDKLWNDGYHIYAVGGSDSHNLVEELYEGATLPSIVGDPRTTVYSDNLSAKCILENVKGGHMCITRFVEVVPFITLKVENMKETINYLPGDKLLDVAIDSKYAIYYNVKIKKIEENLIIRLLVNGEAVDEQIIVYDNNNTEKSVEFIYQGTSTPYMWMRVEIKNMQEEFVGYINPIYLGRAESTYHTYQDVWEVMTEEN